MHISVIGPPNVGKSSLLNALSGEDRSLVSEIAGTTRDYIQHSIHLEGFEVSFYDTAGTRETLDPLELAGIKKSQEIVSKSDLKWRVFEFSPDNKVDYGGSENEWHIINKADLLAADDLTFLSQLDSPFCFVVSAKSGEGLDKLKRGLLNHLKGSFTEQDPVVSQRRQIELLQTAAYELSKAQEMFHNEVSPEFVVTHLTEGLNALRSVLEEPSGDEVMDTVFTQFCIGK